MSFKPTLVQNLSQRLVLTPQLRQRIEMLQMTKLELSDLVTQQLSENPVLEELAPEEVSVAGDLANIDYTEVPTSLNGAASGTENPLSSAEPYDRGDNSFSAADAGDFDNSYNGTSTTEFNAQEFGDYTPSSPNAESAPDGGEPREAEIGERDSFEEIDFGQTFEEYLDPGYRTRENEVKDTPTFEQFLSAQEGLADYLNWQLRLTIMKPDVQDAAEAIIGNLNDDGFLDCSLAEIAALGPWPMETVEKALHIVQQLDPTGVGARDLQECLLLQLNYFGYGQRLAAVLVRDYFQKLQSHKWPELARELSVSVEQISQEMKLVRQLEPKPGRKYAPRDEFADTIQELSSKVALFFSDDFLITIHRLPQSFLQDINERYASKGLCQDVQSLVARIIEGVLKSYVKPGQALADEIDRYESLIFLKKTIPDATICI